MNAPCDAWTVVMVMATCQGQCLGMHPGGPSGRDVGNSRGCEGYMSHGMQVLSLRCQSPGARIFI